MTTVKTEDAERLMKRCQSDEKPMYPVTLAMRLRQHALPDPHDEREVMHAQLLRDAADEIERLQSHIPCTPQNTICDRCNNDLIECPRFNFSSLESKRQP